MDREDSEARARQRRIENFTARIEPTFEPDFEGEKTLVVSYNGRQEYRTALSPAEARKVFDLLRAEFNLQ